MDVAIMNLNGNEMNYYGMHFLIVIALFLLVKVNSIFSQHSPLEVQSMVARWEVHVSEYLSFCFHSHHPTCRHVNATFTSIFWDSCMTGQSACLCLTTAPPRPLSGNWKTMSTGCSKGCLIQSIIPSFSVSASVLGAAIKLQSQREGSC